MIQMTLIRLLDHQEDLSDFDDGERPNERCLSWEEFDKLVIMPDRLFKMTFDFIVNMIYLISITTSSFLIAFHMMTFDSMYQLEMTIDAIVLIDMLLYFFTAYEGTDSDDERYQTHLKAII